MYCEGKGKTGMIEHNDQFRGVTHSYLEGVGCGGSAFNFVSPDFYQLVPWEGEGCEPVGYGFDSIAANLRTMHRIEGAVAGIGEDKSLARRRQMIAKVDAKGIIATPANSSVNELVTEAARMSILGDGDPVNIIYDAHPHVEPRHS